MTVRQLDPDHPPVSSWILAAVAGLLALGAILGLALLADSWSGQPDRANAYTLISALGGVVVFEFARFAVTIRSRHRQAIEDEFRLRDVRVEEIRQLLEQVETNRQVLAALQSEIRFRVQQDTLRARRELVEETLLRALQDLDSIRVAQTELGSPSSELSLDDEVAQRIEAALAEAATTEHRRDLGRRLFEATLEGLPLGLGTVSRVLIEARRR